MSSVTMSSADALKITTEIRTFCARPLRQLKLAAELFPTVAKLNRASTTDVSILAIVVKTLNVPLQITFQRAIANQDITEIQFTAV